MARRFIFAFLWSAASAATSHVLFIADGVHDWAALEAKLPRPKGRSLVVPQSFGELGPESASCASEMATGVSGVRNVISPSGLPSGLAAKRRGARTAIVTDSCATDPTAASFFVRNVSRYDVRGIASQLLAANIDVMLGGASRPLFCQGACCVTDRASLARSNCTGPLRGNFGNMKSALAAECAPLPIDYDISLEDMTVAAISRLRATEAGASFFLVVTADRIDRAAHAGNTTELNILYDDFARAVSTAVTALSFRGDAKITVTGDHSTIIGTRLHSPSPVPVLAYGEARVPMSGMSQTGVFATV